MPGKNIIPSWEDVGYVVSDFGDYVGSSYWEGPLPEKLEEKLVHTAFREAGRGFNIVLDNSIVDDLKSGGASALIKNDTLKEEINRYYPQ